MGDKSSDKCYCGTPIHQPDPILSSLLAVNESLGFRETSRGPSTGPSGGLYTVSINVPSRGFFFIALFLIRNLADHFWLINSLISNHWK